MINGSDCFSGLQTVYLLNQGETNIIQIMYICIAQEFS